MYIYMQLYTIFLFLAFTNIYTIGFSVIRNTNMSIHRMNWCRLCGICLTCPRTQKSQFQQGTCHCVERQANHVPPKRVKGEQLFSFRYRHLNLEDIEILIGIQQRFNLPTPPIERNLARANICSTCQQRLRRARMALCSSSSMPHSSQPVPIRFPQISSAPILPPVSSLPCFPKSNISTLRSTFTPSFDTSQQLQNKLPPLAVLANYADQLNTNNNRPTAGPNPDSKINTFSTLSAEHVSDDPDKTLVDPSFSNNKLAPALKKSADGGATKEGLRLLLHG